MFKLIVDSLCTKFGEAAEELIPAIEEMDDAEKYLALNRVIVKAATLDEVRRACTTAGRRKKGGNGKRGPAKR